MTHKEFVEAYNSGKIKVKIDESVSKLMDANLIDKQSQFYTQNWFWWLISLIGLALIIWVIWIGVIVVIMGLMLPKAMKRSSSESVLEKALSDESFYNTMIQHQVLIIKE